MGPPGREHGRHGSHPTGHRRERPTAVTAGGRRSIRCSGRFSGVGSRHAYVAENREQQHTGSRCEQEKRKRSHCCLSVEVTDTARLPTPGTDAAPAASNDRRTHETHKHRDRTRKHRKHRPVRRRARGGFGPAGPSPTPPDGRQGHPWHDAHDDRQHTRKPRKHGDPQPGDPQHQQRATTARPSSPEHQTQRGNAIDESPVARRSRIVSIRQNTHPGGIVRERDTQEWRLHRSRPESDSAVTSPPQASIRTTP